MACQFFNWLLAGEGPSTLQHAMVGIGCLLAYDAVSRWRKSRFERVPRIARDQSGALPHDVKADELRPAA